jgi:hypothetical protein
MLCATGFTEKVFASFATKCNLNAFGFRTTATNLGISSIEGNDSYWRLRVVPEDSDAQPFSAIYALGSMMNHSCDPNVYEQYHYNREKVWIAGKEISEGDELAISYVGAKDAPTNPVAHYAF